MAEWTKDELLLANVQVLAATETRLKPGSALEAVYEATEDVAIEFACQRNLALAALKESRKWLNYFAGRLYSADKGGVTCWVCHRTFPHNIERNGCTVEHDPEMFCAQAVAAIFASDAAIAACSEGK
jgi:hypothetical protein